MTFIEDAVIASLPPDKLQWLKVLQQHNVLKAEALLLLHDAENVDAILGKLEKYFPSLRAAMEEVCLHIGTM